MNKRVSFLILAVAAATSIVSYGLFFNQQRTATAQEYAGSRLTTRVEINEPLPATASDFHLPGTQPGTLTETLIIAQDCGLCHSNYGQQEAEPYYNWSGSMMAQSARDPLFWAALAIANQDVAGSGSLCIRCHAPKAWLEGRAAADGSQLTAADENGVQCHFCHRLVDPEYQDGVSPPEDLDVLALLEEIPALYGGGMYVVDPEDVRRGPWNLQEEGWYVAECWPADQCMNNNPHRPLDWPLESDFHRQSALCGTCHDVLNPMFSGDPVNGYSLDDLDQPLADPATAFPVERTYTEWVLSDYASEPGVYAPQFNPELPDGIVHSCQDCHMPTAASAAAGKDRGAVPCRLDGPTGDPCPDMVSHDLVPVHSFNGANTWIPEVLKQHPEYGDAVNAAALDDGIARAEEMLGKAASLTAVLQDGTLQVRIVNETGHKLPTGYPEGRQMWLTVTAYDSLNQIVYQSGVYDTATGILTHDADIAWFGVEQGLTPDWATQVGLPAGHSFHFVLNNSILFDNRIPPRGFTNDAFAAAGAAPIGANYADGQYWADVTYLLPAGTVRAEVSLHYQTASAEYITFLRDANYTTDDGALLYQLWEETGRSAPVTIAAIEILSQQNWLPIMRQP